MTVVFAHPEWLKALWILPILGGIWLYHELWIQRSIQKLGTTQLVADLLIRRSVWRRIARNIAAIFAITCAVIALANPQKQLGEIEVETSGIDIIFAVDMSRSMLTQDIQPSRLDAAKLIVSNTIEKSVGDRYGIIAFSSSAYPQLPITTDFAAAEMTLSNMNPDFLPSSGSDVSSAIELALSKFDKRLSQDKALIILSDGEDHEGDWEPLIQNALDSGIFVFTVGLGTTDGGPIPERRKGEFHKDENGEVVISKRDASTLMAIADKGQGKYFDGNRLNVSEDIIEELNTLQKAQMGMKKQADMEDQFQFPLALGLLFLGIRSFLGERSSDTLKKWLKKA